MGAGRGGVGLDEGFVFLWGWLRFPVALCLLAVVLSLVYRFGPDVEQRFQRRDPPPHSRQEDLTRRST